MTRPTDLRKRLKRIVALGSLFTIGLPSECAAPRSPYCQLKLVGDPVQLTFSSGTELGAVPSPDGSMLAFESIRPLAWDKHRVEIWVMDTAQGFKSARALVNDGDYNSWPSWSPDGKWISYMSARRLPAGKTMAGQIYKIKVDDGTIVQLTHFPNETVLGDSTSWSPDGRIAFEHDGDIYAVDASGGDATKLLELNALISPGSLWGIQWSPDGARLAFRGAPRGLSSGDQRVWVVDTSGMAPVPVTPGPRDENPFWLDSKHLLFEKWTNGGEVRVCAVCLPAANVECLTRGHVDLSPAVTMNKQTLFFARGRLPHEDVNEWIPETHIYSITLAVGPAEKHRSRGSGRTSGAPLAR